VPEFKLGESSGVRPTRRIVVNNMNFLEAGLARNRRRRMLVQRAEMTSEVELPMNVEGLVAED